MTERIDFTKSEQYTLSIRLSADGFSFSIYNPLTDNDFRLLPNRLFRAKYSVSGLAVEK